MNSESFISKVLQFIIIKLYEYKITWNIEDELYLKMIYPIFTGNKLDLENPKTYNEKIQWLKINDRKEFYTNCADKLKVKDFIKNIVGEEYTIPTLRTYESTDEIDFDQLPNEFVLKTNHDSGGVVVCKDKNHFDKNKCIKKLNWSMNRKYYYLWREWPYKNIKPCIICEKKLGEKNKVPDDYKVLCFNGEAKLIEYHTDRDSDHKQYFYDLNRNLIDINNIDCSNEYAPKKLDLNCCDEMIEISNKLAKYFIHIRVDFFVDKDKLYIGELTFYDGSGIIPWEKNGDKYLGNLLNI